MTQEFYKGFFYGAGSLDINFLKNLIEEIGIDFDTLADKMYDEDKDEYKRDINLFIYEALSIKANNIKKELKERLEELKDEVEEELEEELEDEVEEELEEELDKIEELKDEVEELELPIHVNYLDSFINHALNNEDISSLSIDKIEELLR